MLKKRLSKLIIGFCLIITPAMFVLASAVAKEKAIEISLNDMAPKSSAPGIASSYWAEEVEKMCGGRVKITVHYGGTLLKWNEGFRGTQKGIAHLSTYGMLPGDGFLLNSVITLPFLGLPSQKESGKIFMELMEKFPELRKEWKDIKIITATFMPAVHIHTLKKEVKIPEDIKGMKLYATGGATLGKVVTLAGASPVALDFADIYMALERGLVEGALEHFPSLKTFGALKLPKYHTLFGPGGINMNPLTLIMNEEKYNSLPPDIRKIFAESGHLWSEVFLREDLKFQVDSINEIKEMMDHKITRLTPEEVKPWYDLVKTPIHEKWIKEVESKGLPGKAVYKEALRLIEAHRKRSE